MLNCKSLILISGKETILIVGQEKGISTINKILISSFSLISEDYNFIAARAVNLRGL